MQTICMDGQCLKNFLQEVLNELSKLDERFIKKYNENSNEEYFLEVDVEIPKNLFSLHKDLSYLLERKKLEKVKKLVCGICCSQNTIKTSTKSWFKT